MDLDQLLRAGPRVQPIDVLGEQEEGGDLLLQLRYRPVTGVGLGIVADLLAPAVPLPDQVRVTGEGLGGGELGGVEAPPEAALASEGRDAGLGGDASAGDHEHSLGSSQGIAGPLRLRHHCSSRYPCVHADSRTVGLYRRR